MNDFWNEILPNDMLDRPRSSRIFYGGKFFAYPLKAVEALMKLGVVKSTLCVLSYAKARAVPGAEPDELRGLGDATSSASASSTPSSRATPRRSGACPCKEISADWAAQRIKGLSLGSAIKNALLPQKKQPKDPNNVIKTLINSFKYPRKGPGMMWEACAREDAGARRQDPHGREGRRLRLRRGERRRGRSVSKTRTATKQTLESEHVISSAPMRELINGIQPPSPRRPSTRRTA